MVEKFTGVAGVFAGDEVGVAKGLDSTEGDVSEVANGSGDEGDDRVKVWFRCHQLSGL